MVIAAFNVLFSFGLGIIGLFAGSMAGFTQFSLTFNQLQWLFFTPLALLVAHCVVRYFIRDQKVHATRIERVLGFFAGVIMGAITLSLIALSMLGRA